MNKAPFLRLQKLIGPPLPVIFLDVDGCLNRMPLRHRKDREWVSVSPHAGYWIDVDHEVITSLDALLKEFRGRCEFVWLTTWGKDVALLEDALRGKLCGGYVGAERPAGKFVAMKWKLIALLAHLSDRGDPPFIWIDDEAVSDALLDSPDFAIDGGAGGEPRLLIEPEQGEGITHAHLAGIRAFLELHAPNR